MQTHALPFLRHLSQRAFTLIELSIGLTILSLMAAGALTVGGVVVEQQQFVGSNARVAEAKKALEDYLAVNGRLPCPASRSIPLGTAGFGEENCGAVAAPGFYDPPGVNMRLGALPVRTLGLRDTAMQDEYGNRIQYAVTEDFTSVSTIAGAMGQITLQDANGNNIATANTGNAVGYFLFSTGPDGKGSFRWQTGAGPTTCSGGKDAENCNDTNNIFVDTKYNSGSGAANFFDDMVAWAPKYLMTSNTASLKAAGSTGQVQFNNATYLAGSSNLFWDIVNNRLGVGTSAPEIQLHATAGGMFDHIILGESTTQVDMAYAYESIGVKTNTANLRLQSPQHIVFHTGMTSSEPDDASKQRMVIDPSGNVGIGTTGPTIKLQVEGNANNYIGYFYNAGTRGAMGSGSDYGVVGYARAAGGNAVLGENQNTGARGYLGSLSNGVHGEAAGGGTGVYGHSPSGFGVDGRSDNYHGMYAYTGHNGSTYYGVYAAAPNGVYAALARADGYGIVSNGHAYFGRNGYFCTVNSTGCIVYLSDDGWFVDNNDLWNTYQAGVGYGMIFNGMVDVRGKAAANGVISMYIRAPNGNLMTDMPGGWAGGLATFDIVGASTYMSQNWIRSDRRYKRDIYPLKAEDMLGAIMKLKPMRYYYKEAESAKGEQFGFIAQDVREVMPNLITGKETKTERLGLNYDGLIAPLVASVQTLKKENDALKLRVEAVEKLLKDKGLEIPETSAKPAPDGYAGFDYRGIALMLGGALAGVLIHAGMRRRA